MIGSNDRAFSNQQLPPPNSSILAAGNMIMSQSNNNLKQSIDEQLLQKAKRNMEKATAL